MSDLVDLQTKLAFLERALEALSAVVHEEATARRELEQRLERMERAQRADGEDVGPHHDPPPHY